MRKRLMWIATFVLAICNIVKADDIVTISDLKISAGETKEVNISLENEAEYVAFQFDLYLPEGIMVELFSADRSRIPETSTLDMYQQSDGSYRFILVAVGGKAMSGNNGSIVTLTVKASGSLAFGEKTGCFRRVKLSKADATGPTYSEMLFPITVIEPSVVTVTSVSREYGNDNPVFEYTVTGGALNGTPEITCNASASSVVGEYPISISKGSVTNFNVTFVDGSLTVTKAPLTITAKSYTIKQGDALPAFEATYSGFKNNETSAVLTTQPTITTTATSASAPGTYDITVSGAVAQNYNISYVKGTLTVVDADAVAVTAKSYTREYGEDNPSFGYDVLGAELNGTPEISCEATPSSPVGTYDIIIRKGSLTNYNVTYVKGTLTVTKAPLTVKAKSYSRKQGEENPAFEVEYSGFKNGETESVLTTRPTVTTSATASSNPGTYDIIVSGAAAQNYEIGYVKGTLTVTAADALVVTANSYTITYGDALPTFGYTSSGATISGTPAITCTATSTSPVGTYSITISKGSVTNYNDSYVNGTLTITKAPLTITAKDYTIKQGEELPAFEATYTGFKNNETSAVLTTQPTITTTATSASAPGTYEITVSGAAAQNYNISYVKGTLTVVDADAVAVTAKSYTREYGEDNPSFGYDVLGTELNGTPEISCEATPSSPVGTYEIVIRKGSVTNYNVTYVKGTLTITKAPLTVKAKSYSRKQGEENPAFEVEYSGFKNNETSAVLTTQPTITTTATSASAPGTYDITASGAVAQNYEIGYVKGTLTVTAADALVVTANSYTITYGDALPTFEYTSSGATISGTPTITCTATSTSPVGTYPITISKGSVTNYNDSYVNGTLTITKAPLTITAKSYTIKQGETLPVFEAIYSGFRNGETSAVLTTQPTITTTATSASAPGTYDITVSGAAAQNYNISYVKGTLTIEPNAVKITANSYTIKYGDKIPVFEHTSEGSTPIGTPSITCAATSASPIGQYPIRISRGSVSNGEATFVDGTLTITKAPLTITAKSYSIKQGEPLPATYEINFSGFKNGETKSVLSQQPSVTCAATAASEPGRYDIIVSGAAAKNYEISYVKGTLRIRDLSSIKGDINDDGEVDVTDVVELIDMVLGGIYDAVGDINGDGEVDVTDVVELIDMVLAGE